MRNIVLMLLVGLLLMVAGTNPRGVVWGEEEEKPETKITKIVLYKHGMGYFERRGQVKGDATITLGFKAKDMQDLLTSLFAIDLSGDGKITTVGYDSKDPIEKQLENILIRVPEGAALTHFLTQLKGAKVEVKIGNDTARGHILGIEPVQKKTDEAVITEYKLVLLKEDGAIQPFNLLEVSSMRLLDEPIQKDLKRILEIYLKAKYADRKTVQLNATGKGNRNILIGYLIEMPIWKTSYRLILDEAAKKKPYLQGWAIVENPTDEDWKDVEISFVAGNPISFKLDLYTSYYPQRPEISLGSLIPLVGQIFDLNTMVQRERAGWEELSKLKSEMEASDEYDGYRAKNMKEASRKATQAPGLPALKRPLSELMTESISSLATGVQIGELFAYEAKTPVSIERQKAAMVPIVTENVEGTKILYYRGSISPIPMNAFYLTNSTKLTLETGPVTFFEGATSVGEGLLKKSLQPGMKEIVPYAMETACVMEPIAKSLDRPVHKTSLTNGVMVLRHYQIREMVYKIINKTGKNYILYLDHPKAGGYDLIEPKSAEEEIEGYYRFKTEVGAGKTVEFKVQEQIETSSQIYLRNTSLDQIKFYIGQPYFSKRVKEFLGELQKLMGQIAEQDRIYRESEAEYRRLGEDQNQLRLNMQSLRPDNPKERDLRDEWVDELKKLTDQSKALKDKMREAQDARRALETDLVKRLQEFNEE